MTYQPPSSPIVLVADSHDVARAGIVSLLESMDITPIQAHDGAQAIHVIQNQLVDLVIFDPDMSPVDGFELARYIQVSFPKLPCIMMTTDKTSDLLTFAGSVGVQHILSKPVDPSRLTKVIQHVLNKTSPSRNHLSYSVAADRLPLSPKECMQHAIDLARKNVLSSLGGPFAAVVVNNDGYVIGEGVNLPSSRFDPIAHAEVMAIRKATEYMQQPHLEGCRIFSTSEPTRLAIALIESVGITDMTYGAGHEDVAGLADLHLEDACAWIKPHAPRPPLTIHRLFQNEVLALLLECGNKNQ